MATGFVQRYKGKITVPVGGLWIGGTQVNTSGADANTSVGWGTVNQSTAVGGLITSTVPIPNGGVTLVTSTALANGIYTMQAASPGRTVVFAVTTGSTAWMLKSPANVIFQNCPSVNGGSSITSVIKSTASLVATEVELIGISTSAYMFMGVTPSTLSHLLFSTTT